MRGHGAHNEMQVMLRDVLAVLLLHHLQGFVFRLVATLVVVERGLHFPVMYLMLVRVSGAGVLVAETVRAIKGSVPNGTYLRRNILNS